MASNLALRRYPREIAPSDPKLPLRLLEPSHTDNNQYTYPSQLKVVRAAYEAMLAAVLRS